MKDDMLNSRNYAENNMATCIDQALAFKLVRSYFCLIYYWYILVCVSAPSSWVGNPRTLDRLLFCPCGAVEQVPGKSPFKNFWFSQQG